GPGLLALLDRLAGGLLPDLERQPHLGASGSAFAGAAPQTVSAAERARELFRLADSWVAARLGEAERREESLRITPALRGDDGWSDIRIAGANAVTTLAALDVNLRKAVGGVREWLGGGEPDRGMRALGVVRGRRESARCVVED